MADPMRPRILFIGIDFYAYVREIRAAFERIGYDSDFHPIESTDFWSKTAKKFAPGPYQKRLDAYHARLIELSAATRYDMVLFIQVHHMSHANMARLRDAFLTELHSLFALRLVRGAGFESDLVKQRLLDVCERLLGKDVVGDIILREVERKQPRTS